MALVAAGLAVFIGVCGLASDVGYLYSARRNMQTAADAAAIAGATALRDGQTVTTAAQGVAKLNGFTDGTNQATVTVNNPPASGSYAGNSSYVEVVVEQPQPTFFLRVLGYNTIAVSARAVSGAISGPACMYTLNPTASNAFVVSGGSPATANCGVLIRSSSSSGLVVSGGSTLSASSIGVVASGYSASSSTVTPTPITKIAPFGDPLAYLQPPSVGSCTRTNYKANSSTSISEGVYCGGITVSGGSTTLTLNPGTYILEGGGLTVSGGASIVGNGVTFYNTQGGGFSYKPVVVSGGSATNLTAPSSGSLAGVLFFQDRSISNTQQNTVSGGSGAVFQGALYFPTTPLVYSGGSAINTAYTIMVADTITISGTTTVNSNYASVSGGSPIKSDTLYE